MPPSLRFPRRTTRAQQDLSCIFVHAGAGYHSRDNEALHLKACHDACHSAMSLLKAGGSAVDAVEVAIRVLEDREITNAGFGSNLGFDGVVECDAIVVDHMGRSGAAGAVAQIKNPISLARLLLDHSTQSLSLRRVPPNLLVGQGATQFAAEHGMGTVPFDLLISPYARHRWQKWRADLNRAERHRRREEAKAYGSPLPSSQLSPTASEHDLPSVYGEHEESEQTRKTHKMNELALAASLYNEAQPASPPPTSGPVEDESSSPTKGRTPSAISLTDTLMTGMTTPASSFEQPNTYSDPRGPPGPLASLANHSFANSTSKLSPPLTSSYARTPSRSTGDGLNESTGTIGFVAGTPLRQSHEASSSSDSGRRTSPQRDEDVITDTVGAIAIDVYGNIACGASSGGIGMKHRGRIGPAALIGIGATVLPAEDDDEEKTTVATVTSGTGEHMSTTMASSVCSDRIYYSHKKKKTGMYEQCMEEAAIHSFIQKDFMGHPSVKHSESTSAIGMLSVKKTTEGVFLFFGHNTDSFALASMHSDEMDPVCTMSRSNGGGSIAQGGRPIWFRRKGK